MLSPGDLIWVRIPKLGYVGVGKVEAPATPAKDFKIETADGLKSCLEVLSESDYHREYTDDPENTEYFVKVRWLDTVPLDKAFHETGFFGQQNSVCKPTTPKWRHTTDRLKEHFKKWKG